MTRRKEGGEIENVAVTHIVRHFLLGSYLGFYWSFFFPGIFFICKLWPDLGHFNLTFLYLGFLSIPDFILFFPAKEQSFSSCGIIYFQHYFALERSKVV